MATEKIGIEVEVKGAEKSISSFKDLKTAIKAAKDEQIAMTSKFGENSIEATKAGQKLAGLKDKVEDLNDSTKSLKGSGVEKLTSSFRLLGEGIGTFDFDKVKTGFKGIGSAMSAIPIFLVIEGLKLLWDNFDKVKEVVGKLIPALKETVSIKNELNNASLEGAKNAAIEKNNLDTLYQASTDQTKSLEERKKAQIALQDSYPLTFKNFSDEQFALGLAKKGYDDLSKSILDSSMLKAKQSLLDKLAIEFSEGEQKRLNEITEAKEKLTSASKKANVSIDIESKTRQVLTSDYENQQSAIDDLIKANTAETEAFKKKNADILGDLAQHQDGANKLDAEQAAAKEKADKLLADKLLNNNKNYGKKAAEDKFADEKRLLADIEKAKEESYLRSLKSDEARAVAKAQFDNDKLIEDVNKSKAHQSVKDELLKELAIKLESDLLIIKNDFQGKRVAQEKAAEVKKDTEDTAFRTKQLSDADIDNKKWVANYLSNKESAYQLELEQIEGNDLLKLQKEQEHLDVVYQMNIDTVTLLGTNKIDIDNKYAKDKIALEKKIAAETKKIKQEEISKGLENIKNALQTGQNLSDLYFSIKSAKVKKGSKEEMDLAKQQFEMNKKFNLAMALINGVQSVLAITTVPDFTLGVASAIRIAASVTATAAGIAKIATAQFEGGGGGGGSVPDTSASVASAPTAQAPSIYGPGQGQSTTFSGNQNNSFAPVKAYVVETENRSTTNRVNKLVSESTYG
jgi:transcriptional regulator NrdR family protein